MRQHRGAAIGDVIDSHTRLITLNAANIPSTDNQSRALISGIAFEVCTVCTIDPRDRPGNLGKPVQRDVT